ncbi:MAG: metal ABC transporter ATP-binding protein [candidate division KSB1 bacterium]|nr:metal ABC transporter ATP-binding protein [candidate division KSB1 bacterium]
MKHEQPVIETKHLYVAYQDKLVLEDVTFAVNRSEFLGILGPNGSGKSTLLKAILGLIQPLSGEAFVFGKTSTRLNKERRRIGYVPQSVDINLQFPIDVWDTVMLGRSRLIGPGKRPGDPDKRAVRQALEQVELDELANQPIGHLSGGQRQRALIARALAVEPDLLILDEPTAALDINSTESFYEWLYKMQKQMKLTLLIVSHDVGVVSQYVDAVACLNRKLVTHGIPNQVLGKDTLEEMYGCEAMFFGHGDVPHLVVPRKNGSDSTDD